MKIEQGVQINIFSLSRRKKKWLEATSLASKKLKKKINIQIKVVWVPNLVDLWI